MSPQRHHGTGVFTVENNVAITSNQSKQRCWRLTRLTLLTGIYSKRPGVDVLTGTCDGVHYVS